MLDWFSFRAGFVPREGAQGWHGRFCVEPFRFDFRHMIGSLQLSIHWRGYQRIYREIRLLFVLSLIELLIFESSARPRLDIPLSPRRASLTLKRNILHVDRNLVSSHPTLRQPTAHHYSPPKPPQLSPQSLVLSLVPSPSRDHPHGPRRQRR